MYFPNAKYFPAAVKPIFLYNYVSINTPLISIEPEATFIMKMRIALYV
jgi:hypothetical protein